MYFTKEECKPVGICANSGKVVPLDRLVKQYEYAGNDLVWTGAMVDREEADEPNPQNCVVIPRAQPQPVENLSPYIEKYYPHAPRNLSLGAITSTSIELNWEVVKDTEFYNVYWSNDLEEFNLLNNFINGNEDPFDLTSLSGHLPLGNNPTYTITGLLPSTAYLLQVASINDVKQPVFQAGPYKWNKMSDWSYFISPPTLINYAIMVQTSNI